MPDCHLQRPLTDVVVQGHAPATQKERQFLPMPTHVSNASTQGRIGLHAMLVELTAKPGMEFLHDRAAVSLMQEQLLQQARDSVPWRARRCDRPLRVTPTRGGIPRETAPPRRRISVAQCQAIAGRSFPARRGKFSATRHRDIWIGGGRSVARRINTSLSVPLPACWCPLRNKAIFSPPPISATMPVVNMPRALGFGLLCRRLRPASGYPARRRSASRRVSSHFGRIFYRPVFGGIFHGLINQVPRSMPAGPSSPES